MLNGKKTLLFLVCGIYKPSKKKVFGSGGILSILLFSGSINERVLFLFIYFFIFFIFLCVCFADLLVEVCMQKSMRNLY